LKLPDSDSPLDDALAALQKPLEFARRNDFEKLDRVKDLAVTLREALGRARRLATDVATLAELAAMAQLIPDDDEPRAHRMVCLSGLAQRLHMLRGSGCDGGDASSVGHRPDPPSADPAPPPTPVLEGDDNSCGSRPRPVPALDAPLQYLPGVGPRLAELFATRGLKTVDDLLRFLPRRYEDRRGMLAIRHLVEGTQATVAGEVLAKAEKRFRGRKSLEVVIGDATGILNLKWFKVPGRGYAERFSRGRKVRVSGQIRRYRGQLQIVHPETELIDDEQSGDAAQVQDAFVPVYPEIEGLRPAHVRRIIANALPAARDLEDVLPTKLLDHRRLPSIRSAIPCLHRPPQDSSFEDLHNCATPWYRRLIYEELFLVQLVVLQKKARSAKQPGLAIGFDQSFAATAAELFPFELTRAQRRVVTEMEADLREPCPMNRLLQGDVGCGKTAVAVTAAAAVARAGLQTAIMAPTEILAEQHARVALKTLTAAGIRIALLTGSATASGKREVLGGLANGHIQVVVGTHALIQDDVHFKRLALGIVDEQHRFGVMQRARLVELGREGLGRAPHMLVMTATPIPRTLALTVYGDLDLSLIDEMPPGRTPVETQRYKEKQREQVYGRVRAQVDAGRQAYVVFPLVEGSDADGLETIRDATGSAEELANGPLKGIRVGLLHGRMSSDDKDRIMRRFNEGDIQVLVSTTVIEVGIDVHNATVMVVEHAERFGLSQLHQLRGRVGRGVHPGLCLLVSRYTPSEDAWRRLMIMEKTNDGFRIAEEDLAIRGPGDFLGTRQSGVPLLAVANLARDQGILQDAREDAATILKTDPELQKPEHRRLHALVSDVWQKRLELAQIG